MDLENLYYKGLKNEELYDEETGNALFECISTLSKNGLAPFYIASALKNAAIDTLVYGDDEHKKASIKVLSQSFIDVGKELQAYLRRRELQVHTNMQKTSQDKETP